MVFHKYFVNYEIIILNFSLGKIPIGQRTNRSILYFYLADNKQFYKKLSIKIMDLTQQLFIAIKPIEYF